MVLGKLPRSPNSNSNPKPNPEPDRGAIFLGGNFPGTLLNYTHTGIVTLFSINNLIVLSAASLLGFLKD